MGDALIGSRAFENASHDPLASGAEAAFDFTPEDFSAQASAIDLHRFRFDLFVTDAQGKETTVRAGIPLSAQYTWTYFYTITGDLASGLVLNEG